MVEPGSVRTCIDDQISTFEVFGKEKVAWARAGEYGGCGKTVTFSDFKYCFTSSDVCEGALS
jgi:hypothetical protein